jgi:hypothetical protein
MSTTRPTTSSDGKDVFQDRYPSEHRPDEDPSAPPNKVRYAGIQPWHAVRDVSILSTVEDSDLTDSVCEPSGARLTRLDVHEIWHRCNINNRGLLDEAMDFMQM